MHAETSAYIGLGSNLDNPAAHLRRAFTELAALPGTRLLAQSRIYQSKPLGSPDQPDYLNAVVVLRTRLEPLELLGHLRALEQQQGRQRASELHWGPRCLDLDILVYDDVSMHTPELTLPHPGAHQRSFVLYPLAELAPELLIPGHGSVRELREHCRTPAIELYEESANG